jgi:two-component system sensor histidine kinase UhpB
VQEGLTNAFRHADATTIEIVLKPADEGAALPGAKRSADARPGVHVTVADNGKGLAEEMQPSYGIAGMNERVWATGGEIRLFNRGSGGVTLEAWAPASAAAATAAGAA